MCDGMCWACGAVGATRAYLSAAGTPRAASGSKSYAWMM